MKREKGFSRVTLVALTILLLCIPVLPQAFKYLQGESVFFKILNTKPNKQNIPSGYVAQYADSGGLKYEGKNGTVITVMDSGNATDFILNAHGTISVNSTTYALDSSALANANVGPSASTDKTITSITNGTDGQELTLHFTGIVTVSTAAAKLLGNVNFVAANHDSLTLKYNGTEWYEIGRQQQAGLLGVAISGTTGAFSSTLAVTGNFAIATNKFTVTASNGNTAVAGTLGVTGDFAVATNKFAVTASSGDTTVAGTLGVTGATTLTTATASTSVSSPSHIATGANGSAVTLHTATATISGLSGATGTATNLIPAGSVVIGVVTRVATLVTSGAGTAFTVGDGTTPDLWGSGVAFTAGTTTTGADFKSTFTPLVYPSATSVVVTCTGGTFTAGAVEVVVFYWSFTAPTS